jgi:hypothetical protein
MPQDTAKILYFIDEMGRIMMLLKPKMRQNPTSSIKSPDSQDTYCFIFLFGYRPTEGRA